MNPFESIARQTIWDNERGFGIIRTHPQNSAESLKAWGFLIESFITRCENELHVHVENVIDKMMLATGFENTLNQILEFGS